jgi:hypothetical protein
MKKSILVLFLWLLSGISLLESTGPEVLDVATAGELLEKPVDVSLVDCYSDPKVWLAAGIGGGFVMASKLDQETLRALVSWGLAKIVMVPDPAGMRFTSIAKSSFGVRFLVSALTISVGAALLGQTIRLFSWAISLIPVELQDAIVKDHGTGPTYL